MASDVHAHRRLLRVYLRPALRRVGGLAALLLASQLAPLAAPLVLRHFIDRAVAGAALGTLAATAAAYLALALAGQALAVLVTWAGTRLAWEVTDRVRVDLARHVLGLDMAWHGRHNPGELIERIDGDPTAISEFFSRVVLQVLGALLLLVGILVVVFVEDWRAGTVLLLFAAIAGMVLRRVGDRAVPAATADRAATADLYGGLEERFAGLEDLRANGGGPHAVACFHEQSATAYAARVRAEIHGGAVYAAAHATFAIGAGVALVMGVWLHSHDAITIGTVFLLFQYAQMVRRPLEVIADQLRALQKAGAGAFRVASLLDERATIVSGSRDDGPAGPLAVTLDHVDFVYGDGTEALADVSFTVEPGRILGVVGHTGSGKTTVTRLLLRLYDVTAGSVRIGGVDVRDFSLPALRSRVGLVPQDVQLFEATVRDNVTMFREDVTDEELARVLDALELGPWWRSLPGGLDARLGPAGAGLSAGEAQLLAFARVFLRDPGVVILDEASSRLDPATERRIERAVDRLLEGRTGVLIAHRLSTLERADDIVVLDDGRVVEQGPRPVLGADPSTHFAALLELTRGGSTP